MKTSLRNGEPAARATGRWRSPRCTPWPIGALLIAVAALAALTPMAHAQTNLAPQGSAYRWDGNSSELSNARRSPAAGLTDGDLTTDVNLHGTGGESASTFEAAGVVWPSVQSFNAVSFVNGLWESSGDGAFCADLKLQTTLDGTVWSNTSWNVNPAYSYGAGDAGVTYRFSGATLTARGVRISGRLHCAEQSSYWANVRELQVTGAPTVPGYGLWDDAFTPATIDAGDAQAVELGMRFRVVAAGLVTGLRFYKAPANTGTHVGSLWSATGALLARGTFSGESASGWQQLNFATPIAIEPNKIYVVSYHAPRGHYSDNINFFRDSGRIIGPIEAPRSDATAGNGVFKYGAAPAFPNESWNASNYWVDVVFVVGNDWPDGKPPTAPSNVSAIAASASRINVSWSPSTDNVGISKYRVYRQDRNNGWLAETTSTSYADTSVVAGTTYTYWIQALDTASNPSVFSATASATTPAAPAGDTTPPSVPGTLNASAASSTRVNLSWTASTDNVGVARYEVLRNGAATPIGSTSGTSYADTAVAASTNYSYRVRAVDAANNVSGLSNTALVSTPAVADTAPPSAPASLSASAVSTTRVDLAWTASSDNVGVTKYRVFRNGAATAIGEAGGTAYTDASVAASTAYSYTVRAYDAAGNASGASPAASVTTPSGSSAGLNLPRVAWEGGPSYYAQFPQTAAANWTSASFFPIGAWYMRANSQADIDRYKALGFNTVVAVEDPASLPLMKSNGIWAIHGYAGDARLGSETVSWQLGDEADMWGGPGSSAWTGNYPGQGAICNPDGSACGYTVMQTYANETPNDARARHSNFGKGVVFWESDADAAKFVNSYTTIVSTDVYWYTDGNVCSAAEGPTLLPGSGPISPYTGLHDLTQAECRRAANYGAVMDKVRRLNGLAPKRQPVWAFVEMGTPGGNGMTITPAQMAGAVMSSIIHEARGILYFKHNFGGSCQTNDAIIDNCYPQTNAKIAEVNARIKELAPVLNTQSYEWKFNPELDTMLKGHGGAYYVFAMIGAAPAPVRTTPYTFTLPPELRTASVEVLYENRTLPVSGGAFSDSFSAENTYHVYRITPAATAQAAAVSKTVRAAK